VNFVAALKCYRNRRNETVVQLTQFIEKKRFVERNKTTVTRKVANKALGGWLPAVGKSLRRLRFE
jgi:hypothetical protein